MLNLDVVHFCGICVQVFIWTSSVNRPMSKPNPTRTVVATWFWPVCVSVEVWRVLRNCDDHHPVFIVRAAVVVVEVVVKLWCLTFVKRTHFTRSNTRVISNINDRGTRGVPNIFKLRYFYSNMLRSTSIYTSQLTSSSFTLHKSHPSMFACNVGERTNLGQLVAWCLLGAVIFHRLIERIPHVTQSKWGVPSGKAIA